MGNLSDLYGCYYQSVNMSFFTRTKAVSVVWPLLHGNCNNLLGLLLNKYVFWWKPTAPFITLEIIARFEIVMHSFRILQSTLGFLINGFIMAAFVDLMETPRYNDLLTIFEIGLTL